MSINKYDRWKRHQKTHLRAPRERMKNELLKSEWKRIKTQRTAQDIILFLQRCSIAMKLSSESLIKLIESSKSECNSV